MKQQSKAFLIGLGTGLAGSLVLLAALGLLLVYTGGYNVAATEKHTSVVRWGMDTTFKNAVRRLAGGVTAPEDITPASLETGASHYKAMCQHCHGGPGVERSEWASGMRPRPPHLAEAAADWELTQVFWLAKHGVKMTGMPAFGPTHDDQTLWGIAAFVKELTAMTPERYTALGDSDSGGDPETHDEHSH